jgi:molecular chaperone GrpE
VDYQENNLFKSDVREPQGDSRPQPDETMESDTAADGDGAQLSEQNELTLLQANLEEKTRESQENHERFLRARADLDNVKKRFQREKEDILRYASQSVIEKLLPVIDNFTRAREAALQSRDFDGLCQGVEMIESKLMEILENEGVTAIDPLHEPFDPRYHEPLMVEDNSDWPDNTVIEVFQKGYLMKGKLIRPSLVKVSKSETAKE